MTITSAAELTKLTAEHGSIARAVIMHESQSQARPAAEIVAQMQKALAVMRDSVAKGIAGGRRSLGGLIGGEAAMLDAYTNKGTTLAGPVAVRAAMMAIAVSEVNASMGRIVAAPTAGSCGILPGSLLASAEVLGKDDEAIVDALFVASGIGMIIARNATIAGAEGGCMAECGAAASMAAAACASLAGGDTETVLNAAALALKNELGLACDPIAGLVEVPCAKRNSLKAVEALVAADMALAGIKSIIPFDEVVLAMHHIARDMPLNIKETANGGLAITPTGLRLAKEILGK
jgi:L-serine dehydratase